MVEWVHETNHSRIVAGCIAQAVLVGIAAICFALAFR